MTAGKLTTAGEFVKLNDVMLFVTCHPVIYNHIYTVVFVTYGLNLHRKGGGLEGEVGSCRVADEVGGDDVHVAEDSCVYLPACQQPSTTV